MTRYLLMAIIFAYAFTQEKSLFAQIKKLEGTEIEFTLPSTKWTLAVSNRNGGNAIYVYQKEVNDNIKLKPSIAFIVDALQDDQRPVVYLRNKMKGANIKEVQFHMDVNNKMLALAESAIYTGFSAGDTVYVAAGVRNNRRQAVMIMCSGQGRPLKDFNSEFLSFLSSVRYSWQTKKADPSTANGSTTTSPSSKTPAVTPSAKTITNTCDYFPVVSGMRFNYTRTDMAGTHSIIEQYATSKDKVLESGKALKGYRVRTSVKERDNSIIYYYCDNGSTKFYTELQSYDTEIIGNVEDEDLFPDYNKPDFKKTPIWETEKSGTGQYLNFTELKAGNVGTEWRDVKVIKNNPVIISSKIMETGLTLEVQGKTYSPVIRVKRTVTINFQGEDMQLNSQDIYYAKGVGKVKVVETGNDILMGSYTTTQELVSYAIPGAK